MRAYGGRNVGPEAVQGPSSTGVVDETFSALIDGVLGELFECLVEEEHEVLQNAELSGELTQRTTSEAPQRLCTSSDWMYTRS